MRVLFADSFSSRPCARFILALNVFLLIATGGITVTANAAESVFPFRTGEKMTFEAKWSFIPVGEAVLEVMPVKIINGIRARHFLMTVNTNKFADVFYKIRDRFDSYTDMGMTRSVLYKKLQQGKSKRDAVANFDWKKGEVQYTNFDNKKAPIKLLPGSFDPLSIFYFFRMHDLEKNKEIKTAVTDGKKCVVGKARVIRREKIKLKSGTYDTYLVELETKHIGGVFEKSKHAKLQVWVTADALRIPVKVKSRVIVGSFVAELIKAEKTGQDTARVSRR